MTRTWNKLSESKLNLIQKLGLQLGLGLLETKEELLIPSFDVIMGMQWLEI